jgi:hypothetical protein
MQIDFINDAGQFAFQTLLNFTAVSASVPVRRARSV